MSVNDQRFGCTVCGKTWTGMQLEHCKACHETFNNTRAGDKHREVDYTYAVVRWPSGDLGRLRQEGLASITKIEGMVKVISENNQAFRCLTPDEMRAKGMNCEKNGCWNSGGNWSPAIYKVGVPAMV